LSGGGPSRFWRFGQTYEHLLLVHWTVPVDQLKRLLPAPLEVATLDDGQAFIGHDVYVADKARVLGGLPLPLPARPIVTLRTIVNVAGARGLFLFSLDAPGAFSGWLERTLIGLRSFEADVDIKPDGDALVVRSRRKTGEAELVARYRATGPGQTPAPGSRDEFLLGGDRLFTSDDAGAVREVDVEHGPWLLQPAEVTFEKNTIAAVAGLPGPGSAVTAVYQRAQDAYAALPKSLPAVRAY
jgi:uncharacterized protein YqjF (DUF2071 family)